MKLRIGVILVSAMALFALLSSACIVFAQPWDACVVNAQCTDLVTDETAGFFSFTVISPDPGTTNSITAVEYVSGDSAEEFLSPGDTVVVSYTGFAEDDLVYNSGSGYLYYQGPADSVTINTIEIPEFSSFLILPLFMIATLLAIIGYRRKLTS